MKMRIGRNGRCWLYKEFLRVYFLGSLFKEFLKFLRIFFFDGSLSAGYHSLVLLSFNEQDVADPEKANVLYGQLIHPARINDA